MTEEEKAREKARGYDTKYAEDSVLEDMLSRPTDFREGAIADIVNLLREKAYRDGYLAGAKENGVVWHKITDWKNQEQCPQEETFPFFVRTKKDGDYLCEWEITEGYGQFYSMYEGEDIDPKDVVLWAKIEIPQFKE